MSQNRSRPSASRVLEVLFVWSPLLVPAAILVLLAVAFLITIVVYAFMEGFEAGLGALAGLIGIPSVVFLWLRSVKGVLFSPPKQVGPPPLLPRYSTIPSAQRRREQDDEDEAWRHHHGW